MPKFAYVAVTPDGQQVKGTPGPPAAATPRSRSTSRSSVTCGSRRRRASCKYEISGPRIKRDEVMHLSRQLAAFLRAGLPILEAVHTIGDGERRTPRCAG